MKKKILVTGLVGKHLCLRLLESGHELVLLGRSSESTFRKTFTLPCRYYQWKYPEKDLPPSESINVDAVIHLAGEPIAQRWTSRVKQLIRDSRVLSTRNLVSALNTKVNTFICASAIGIYGDCGDQKLTENSPIAKDFLGQLCQDWENEARKFSGRSAQLRFGVVLSETGGALSKMQSLFEYGFGGHVGRGHQWMSWIHIEDLVGIIVHCLYESTSGSVNAVSPNPVTNREFSSTLAKVLKTKSWLPSPRLALYAMFGEMSEVILASQKVVPEKIVAAGYEFKYPKLSGALENLFAWKESRLDHLYVQEQWVPQPVDHIFDFFSDEKNLEELTPDFLNFKVLGKSTPQIEKGTRINYKLKIHGVPANWTSEITEWYPGKSFVDVQVAGPYSKWKHKHTFTLLAGGVLMRDEVTYQLPLAPLGGELLLPIVKKDIESIFAYRKEKIQKHFGR
jgi:uncharacterized protein